MKFRTPTVSPLRQRMLDDMRMRKLQPRTQAGYIRAVRRLTIFLERAPDTATAEDTLPSGLHRIRHYGLLANANRKASLATARELLGQVPPSRGAAGDADADVDRAPCFVCGNCGAALIVVETLLRSPRIRAQPAP